MKKPQFWVSLIAFIFGLGMVIISLNTSVPTGYPEFESHRQFYLDNTILPDHIVYPVLMIVDRAQLEATSFPDRLWLQAEYGWRRLDYAHKLLEKDKPDLALTALTKSQKYFLNASQEVLDMETTDEVKLLMLKHLTAYLSESKMVADGFEGANKAVSEHLIAECEVLKQRLSQSLSK